MMAGEVAAEHGETGEVEWEGEELQGNDDEEEEESPSVDAERRCPDDGCGEDEGVNEKECEGAAGEAETFIIPSTAAAPTPSSMLGGEAIGEWEAPAGKFIPKGHTSQTKQKPTRPLELLALHFGS
eukprot:GHVT01034906.1.p2 GENE.GHVT01034906.1~~GHVT01034906.1.p2  ORF type:complete len:126 (+),score=39.96 GHVT01034906.1:1036-1413(+)